MYRSIARHILAPALELSRGSSALKCLKELEESQWWSRDRILELQDQRLSQLLQHAYQSVPYYRRIFDGRGIKPADIKCCRDLIKLPVLNKRLIRENFSDITAHNFPQRQVITSCTAGSTGEPLMFYRTKEERYNWAFAAAIRASRWAGYEIGDKSVHLATRQRVREPSAAAKTAEKMRFFFQRIVYCDIAELAAKLPQLAQKIVTFQPKFIRGYTSAIYLLARFIEKNVGHEIRPQAVITGAEPVYEHQRDLFSKVFQCHTYSIYSTQEQHCIAAECPAHMGYHISSENVIVEIVDAENNPVAAGEEGRILITNLHNFFMPFIRYDIGDTGTATEASCPCGRGLPLLTKLNGRVTDFIITRSGKAIPGITLPFSALARLHVDQFQIVQESYTNVVVKLVLQKDCAANRDEIAQEVTLLYRPILGDDMNIDVEFADHIPVTKAGKTHFVISKVAQRFC